MLTYFLLSLHKLKRFDMGNIDFSEPAYDPDMHRDSGLITDE